jgi:thiamine biosynthesis lipoprotein ApbE
VKIGESQRAIGPGPGGRGWLARLEELELESTSISQIHLLDRSLTVMRANHRPIRVGSERLAPYLDQRRRGAAPVSAQPGRPQEGVLAVAVVTELAVDAQGLAGALFVFGSFEGQYRLGSLRPAPSALWVLGGEGGEPIVSSSHWSLAQP